MQCHSTSGEARFENGSGVASFAGAETVNEAFAAQPVERQAKNGLQAWLAESRRLRSQLQSYGVAGLLAYGLLNTLYYSGAFLIIWLYIVKVPRGIGLSEACKQFVAAVSLTWASSQVTKVPRVALAVLIAPVADGCLIFLQARLRLRRRRNAAAAIIAACFTLVALIFAATVAMWA